MRILIATYTHQLLNHGDTAMLQVAVERLSKLWPKAKIEVITLAPERLTSYCPKAHPVLVRGREMWFKSRLLIGRLVRITPKIISNRLLELEEKVMLNWPMLSHSLIRLKMNYRQIDTKDMDTFLDAVLGADLVFAAGGGHITDAFYYNALMILKTLKMTIRRSTPTAMLGQGFGPIQHPKLLKMAKIVLPSVNFIALRESRASLVLLNSLGVSLRRVVTTGDDAIELAYKKHAIGWENGIGVNLRVASYSEVDKDLIEIVRAVLYEAAMKHSASMIPVPISLNELDSDPKAIRQLIAGYDDASDGGESIDTPLKVIEQIGRCRIVVTGSYHAAVFALSQGIPVVGLAKSAYYVNKFLGLADQFGTGCEVIFLQDKQLREKLITGIDTAWRSAEQVKPQLIEAAERQIVLSRAAYQRIYDLVESKKAKA